MEDAHGLAGGARLKKCAVLVVDPSAAAGRQSAFLRQHGFKVVETAEWPIENGEVEHYEVVIVFTPDLAGAPMLAARMRAKPQFGRRVLVAMLPVALMPRDTLALRSSGFDEVLHDASDGRLLLAKVLRRLRERPEYRCLLPGKRAA
jgi:hypothetical protein